MKNVMLKRTKPLVAVLLTSFMILSCGKQRISASTTDTPTDTPTDSPTSTPFSCANYQSSTPFAYGEGTDASPYFICTAAQLNNIGADSSKWGAVFELKADINLSAYNGGSAETTFNTMGVLDHSALGTVSAGLTPTGSTPFTGKFNGGGFTISNLIITKTGTAGAALFPYTLGATLSNIKLSNVTISGTSYAAALVGFNKNTTVSNSSVSSGTVTGTAAATENRIAGLIAHNYADGSGINGNVSGCFSSGLTITGRDNVGGLIGRNDTYNGASANVSNSYNTSHLQSIGSGNTFGGLIGINTADGSGSTATISSSYSTGNITISTGTSGGFCGAFSGGLIGTNRTTNSGTDASISNSYSSGTFTSSATCRSGLTGGIVGSLGMNTTNSANLTQVHSSMNLVFTNAENNFHIGGLVGSFSNSVAGGTFIMTDSYYSGSISSTSGTGPNPAGGLFGSLTVSNATASATITKSYSAGSITTAHASTNGVGGLAGSAVSSGGAGLININKSYSTMTIAASSAPRVGGLVGNATALTLANNYYQGSITASTQSGGLLGLINAGTISVSNSYASGTVTGTVSGGFAGQNSGTLSCTTNYWDSDMKATGIGTGSCTSGSNAGLTTVNTRAGANYSGWDFATIWTIVEGVSPPTLR